MTVEGTAAEKAETSSDAVPVAGKVAERGGDEDRGRSDGGC